MKQVREAQAQTEGARKSESPIRARMRVTIAEQRGGGNWERTKATAATHSNGGKTTLAKLERIGKVSKEREKEKLTNLGHVIDFDFLLDCFNQLDGKKAVGVDGITKQDYAADLTANLSELLVRIRRGTYRPSAARLVEIPKEDGSTRPLAISCIEDKIVQMATARILESVYEPRFLDCSFGYRPGRSAHDAIASLTHEVSNVTHGALLEIDLKRYFNSIPHDKLMAVLRMRIADERFLSLIETQLRTPIRSDGKEVPTTCGVPQGAILSPVLSNVYLHYGVDRWVEAFESTKSSPLTGRVRLVRYCDDMVFILGKEKDGKIFDALLRERLRKIGIELNENKSSLQVAGLFGIEKLVQTGKRPPTFKFLGFVLHWRRRRGNGRYRLGYKPRADRMRAKLKGLKEYLRQHRNVRNHLTVLRTVKRVVQGWSRYFAITDCGPVVHKFITEARRLIHRWFNNRGGRKFISWKKIAPILKRLDFPSGPGRLRSMFSTYFQG